MPGAAARRFAFGANWQRYLDVAGERHVEAATAGLRRLFPDGELEGARVLDIGCGSGMAMLAALRLGAASVEGIDLDPGSVAAARRLLENGAPGGRWSLAEGDALDLGPGRREAYDVVHAWGVLHHTDDLWAALAAAAGAARPGGRLAVAVYRRTPLCPAWAWEKRFYAGAPAAVQAAIRGAYAGAYLAGVAATGRSPRAYLRDYRDNRGMDWRRDVHDWLGGTPYQSASPAEMEAALARLGLAVERRFVRPPRAFGLLGTHCDEYVARKPG